MKQGQILREYANSKGISVNRMKQDLKKDSTGIYALFKTKQFAKPNYDLILSIYPDFAEFETLHSVTDVKTKFEKQGYNPAPPALNSGGQTTLMKVAVGNSYAALELLSRLVSQAENRPIEEVKKEAETIARERLRIVEDMLFGLISLP